VVASLDQGDDCINFAEAPDRNLRQHEVDVALTHLAENARLATCDVAVIRARLA
jgi:hypothetical protein